MKFCKYEDLERLAKEYSDGMFSLIFPKMNSRKKSLECIERVFTAYIDESPRLKSRRAEEKWLIKRLRKESGFNRLANTYEGEGLSFMELDNMLTSLRVYYNNEGNKPKKRRSALWSLFVVIIIAIVVTIGVVQGIGYYEKSGGSVQEADWRRPLDSGPSEMICRAVPRRGRRSFSGKTSGAGAGQAGR